MGGCPVSREELIEKADRAVRNTACTRRGEAGHPGEDDWSLCTRCDAIAVLNAVLPQVRTLAEVNALPDGAKVLADKGRVWSVRHGGLSDTYLSGGSGEVKQHGIEDELPLTVIWLPEVTA